MAEKSAEEQLSTWKLALGGSGIHLAWAKSQYQDVLALSLSKGEYYVNTEVTGLEMSLNPNILAQKVENMLKSLKYPENVIGPATIHLDAPLKVEPPQAESLEELYANADWDGIVKNNKKGKPKPQLTATQLEKVKKQAVLFSINALIDKDIKEMAKSMLKPDPLMAHLKTK